MESELVVRDAHPGLRDHVERFYGYREVAGRPMRQREPVTPSVILVVGLGPELRLVGDGPPLRLGSFLAGLDDSCAIVEHDGEMRGVQVDLSPPGARTILGAPMHELARRVVSLEDALGPAARLLEEQMAEAPSWEERFTLVERFLGARLEAGVLPPADVTWAWRRLAATGGRVRIAELAQELGCSRKHLAARFREHVGLPPKLVARMMRFRRAADLLLDPPVTSLAELAANCGYYDQAHLDRDFRDFAQTTPTAFLADPRGKVTFVQDAAAVAA